MRRDPRRRIAAVILGWLLFSTALAYWITHDRHVLVRNFDLRPVRPYESSLSKEMLVYCPVCGEPMRLDQTRLSLQVDDGYRTHAHVRVEPRDALEWKRDDE